jgi:hypothetical protein
MTSSLDHLKVYLQGMDQLFAHRHNPDGTIDSICLRCYLTIASKSEEQELEDSEHHHACHPIHLYGNWRDQISTETPLNHPDEVTHSIGSLEARKI